MKIIEFFWQILLMFRCLEFLLEDLTLELIIHDFNDISPLKNSRKKINQYSRTLIGELLFYEAEALPTLIPY